MTINLARHDLKVWPWQRIALPLLVVVAAVLRLVNVNLMEFRHDSAWWAVAAFRALREGVIPLLGQQVGSVNVPLANGPLMTYLVMAVQASLGNDPMRGAILIAVLNILGVVLTYQLGKTLYSPAVGLIAAALLTVAPWFVLFSRMLWPQALLPFLIPLSLLLLIRGLEKNSAWPMLLFGVLMGMGVQLHLSVLASAAAGLLVTVLYARRKWHVIVVGLGILLGYLPILMFDVTHGFPNLQGLLALQQTHSVSGSPLVNMAKAVWNFENVLSGQAMWKSKLSNAPYLPAVIDWGQGLLLMLLFGVGVLTILWRSVRDQISKRNRQSWRNWRLSREDAITLLFFALPMAYLMASRSSIQRHYFIMMCPLPFIVIARGVTIWWSNRVVSGTAYKVMRAAMVIALAASVLFNVVTDLFAMRFVQTTGGVAGYGTVLQDKQQAVSAILAATPDNFSVDVQSVQETLPYVFLFMNNTDVTTQGPEDTARSIDSKTNQRPAHYRLVESAYHESKPSAGETVLFHNRGVIVYASK